MMHLFLKVVCVLVLAAMCGAAQNPSNPDGDLKATINRDCASVNKEPSVVYSNGVMKTQQWTEVNKSVTIALCGFSDWVIKEKNNPNHLRVFLAGRELPRSAPTLISLSQDYVNFPLQLDQADRDLWVQILSSARDAKNNLVPLSVGLRDSHQPFASKVYIALNVYPWYTGYVLALLCLLLFGVAILGKKSTLLRSGSLTSPYSLGFVQMACWFYLVVAAHIYIWLITGGYNSLTPSVLALIGISGGTALAAVFVDNEKVVPAEAPISKGFLNDILSDGRGVSIHRFQIAIWTVVFSIIFIRSVYLELAMPNFDASLLGLMGITSGTYLGFKFPESPKQGSGTNGTN
jgi:hypothetical protein